MSESRLYRRIIRRETHGSRSTAIVVVFVLVIIGAVYVGIECVLAALGSAPLLVAPAASLDAFNARASWMLWAGISAFVFGLVVVIVALTPGRRARHGVANDRMAVVVDDGVLAGAIAGVSARSVDVRLDRVSASVSRGRATVRMTPTSGVPIAASSGQRAVDELLSTLAPRPRVRGVVSVAETGLVGS